MTNSVSTHDSDVNYANDVWWYPDDCVGFSETSGKWYFYDETGMSDGPYDTEHEARLSLVLYCWNNLERHDYATFHSIRYDIYERIKRLEAELNELD